MKFVFPAFIFCGLALSAVAQTPSDQPQFADLKLLLPENAYNPVPSPDGRFIAYVGTGWGQPESFFGFGRASLWSNVGLMDASGKVLIRSLAKDEFLAGWSGGSNALLCFRDGRFSVLTTDGFILDAGDTRRGSEEFAPERVVFLNDLERPAWIDGQEHPAVFRTNSEALPSSGEGSTFAGVQLIAPSPDGRYIAMMSERGTLRVYDRVLRQSSNPVRATISPSPDWDYMQPAWDPWFADSNQLVFFSGRNVVVSSPDGKTQRVVLTADRPGGLAVPSPDGTAIAYVSFRPIERELRPELKFWGNTAVWVVASDGKSAPRQLTSDDPDTTIGLRWLGNDSLVFDRIGQNLIKGMRARIWKVAVR